MRAGQSGLLRLTSLKWLVPALLLAAVAAAVGWRSLYVTWQLRSARQQLSMGSLQQAEAARQLLLETERLHEPDRPELLFLLGRASRRTGQFDDSLQYLNRAEAAGWDSAQIQQQRLLAAAQRGRIDPDDPALKQLLLENASDDLAYEVYEALAKGYLFSYRFGDAVHCLNFWTEWCPQATDPRMWRAGIWEQTERWPEAADEYRGVLKIDPNHLDARLALAGSLLGQLNKVEEARQEFETCLQQAPDNVTAVLGLASCERRLADPERAEARIRELLQQELTDQQRANVQTELGQILIDRGALPEAVQVLTEVTEADPLNSTALYALGTALSGSGQREQAMECFEKSKALTQQFGRLTNITSELANHPEKADLRWEAGRILMDQGLHVEGAAWMATALVYEPDHQPTHESLAWYYENIKHDQKLARHHRSKADAVPPDRMD